VDAAVDADNGELHETREFTESAEVGDLREPHGCLVWRTPFGVCRLIEDFFEAVDRAVIQEAGRISGPRRLELTNDTTANAKRNLANLTNQEQWMGLCELASNEQDQDKLGLLFEGILRLLEDQQVRLGTSANGVPHDTPPLISN
jgi:hypothetical protein